MNFTVEEQLPNVSGHLRKISLEANYESRRVGKQIELKGDVIFIREVKNQNRITEIKDKLPLEISFPINYIIHENEEVSLYLRNLNYEFNEESIKVICELSITNLENTLHKV